MFVIQFLPIIVVIPGFCSEEFSRTDNKSKPDFRVIPQIMKGSLGVDKTTPLLEAKTHIYSFYY